MLAIYLKKESEANSKWDLKVWLENNYRIEKKIFLNEKWINEDDGRVKLTVALDLNKQSLGVHSDVQKISVHWQRDGHGVEKVVNCDKDSCKTHRGLAGSSLNDDYFRDSGMDRLTVDAKGAVFGNDQDKVGGKFQYNQAFEGNFYGLKIYDKFFEPNVDGGIPEGVSLIYSLSPSNIKAEDSN